MTRYEVRQRKGREYGVYIYDLQEQRTVSFYHSQRRWQAEDDCDSSTVSSLTRNGNAARALLATGPKAAPPDARPSPPLLLGGHAQRHLRSRRPSRYG